LTAKPEPLTEVWNFMDMDSTLSTRGVEMRKQTQSLMKGIQKDLIPYMNKAEFPHFVVDKFKTLPIQGFSIKGYGAAGMTNMETGATIYEMAKEDASICSFIMCHNSIGISSIYMLGSEEQK